MRLVECLEELELGALKLKARVRGLLVGVVIGERLEAEDDKVDCWLAKSVVLLDRVRKGSDRDEEGWELERRLLLAELGVLLGTG